MACVLPLSLKDWNWELAESRRNILKTKLVKEKKINSVLKTYLVEVMANCRPVGLTEKDNEHDKVEKTIEWIRNILPHEIV